MLQWIATMFIVVCSGAYALRLLGGKRTQTREGACTGCDVGCGPKTALCHTDQLDYQRVHIHRPDIGAKHET